MDKKNDVTSGLAFGLGATLLWGSYPLWYKPLSQLNAYHLLSWRIVFAEACLLGINPFDQWGVELGKVLARAIEKGEMATLDASTRALVAQASAWRR